MVDFRGQFWDGVFPLQRNSPGNNCERKRLRVEIMGSLHDIKEAMHEKFFKSMCESGGRVKVTASKTPAHTPASSPTSAAGPNGTQHFVCYPFASSSLSDCASGIFSLRGGKTSSNRALTAPTPPETQFEKICNPMPDGA